ncbi:MAG: hypothetical protein PUB07_02080 [Clostridia bacterium]|nr:hypothetical protein [Clostridia bacterium]
MKYKRKWGDRADGRLIRTLPPISKVSPYIMKNRTGAQNLVHYTLDVSNIEAYVRKKRQEGLKNFGILHVLVAAYIRTVSKRPGINRFISGQKIFARHGIDVIMSIKTSMTLEAGDTMIKLPFSPDATADDVYHTFCAELEKTRDALAEESSFDKTARILQYIPGLLLKFSISFLRFLDYFGLLPKSLLYVSPFHGSLVITSMGSLGIPPIYHHLYDFGNVPVFVAYGAKKQDVVLHKSTGEVGLQKYLDFTVTTDERICDGYYYASALKVLRSILEHPSELDAPPEKVLEDIQ